MTACRAKRFAVDKMKRLPIIIMVTFALLLAACSQNDDDAKLPTATADPTPAPTITPDRSPGTRTNPIPIGEFYQIEKGKVRIVGAEVLPDLQSDGRQVLDLDVEYICEIEDPNKSCIGTDFYLYELLSPEGVLLESDGLLLRDNDFYSMEAYGKNTLRGHQYIKFPPGAAFSLVRYRAYGKHVFFDLGQ